MKDGVHRCTGEPINTALNVVSIADIACQIQIMACADYRARIVPLRLPKDQSVAGRPMDIGLDSRADPLADDAKAVGDLTAIIVDQHPQLSAGIGE